MVAKGQPFCAKKKPIYFHNIIFVRPNKQKIQDLFLWINKPANNCIQCRAGWRALLYTSLPVKSIINRWAFPKIYIDIPLEKSNVARLNSPTSSPLYSVQYFSSFFLLFRLHRLYSYIALQSLHSPRAQKFFTASYTGVLSAGLSDCGFQLVFV